MDAKRAWPWLRAGGALVVLGLVAWRVGTGPFLAGLRLVSLPAVLAALGVGVVSTVCSAWRWRRIAADLGVRLPLPVAVGAYYRSQFLNVTLPTGVVGDVHRAVLHGRDIGDVGLGARAVVLERTAGLAAQVTLAALVLLAIPSPLRHTWLPPVVAGTGLAILVVAYVLTRQGLPGGGQRQERGARGWTWAVVGVSSAIILAGHLTVFVIAARAAVPGAAVPMLAAATLPALLAMALPLSFAGWGPREGAAAWAFAGAGLGATAGVTTAVAYGALTLLACLPGAALLLTPTVNRNPSRNRSRAPQGTEAPTEDHRD